MNKKNELDNVVIHTVTGVQTADEHARDLAFKKEFLTALVCNIASSYGDVLKCDIRDDLLQTIYTNSIKELGGNSNVPFNANVCNIFTDEYVVTCFLTIQQKEKQKIKKKFKLFEFFKNIFYKQ